LFDVNELLASVKEFDYLKKKLENRRLDYDAKQNKLNKCKKEKPSLEEEMRAAQYKYEETYSDMQNLMLRFGDKEVFKEF
jgi:phage regulator Rha-like protein